MKAPTMDEWAEKLGTKALNGFVYGGRTLREWIDLMASGYCVVLPDRATNGDVIKALFPNVETNEFAITIHATTKVECNGVKGGISYDFWKEWWNAPYKAGDTDGNS